MFVFDIRGDGSVRDGLNICGTSRGTKALGVGDLTKDRVPTFKDMVGG